MAAQPLTLSVISTHPWFVDALMLWARQRQSVQVTRATLWTEESVWPSEVGAQIRVLMVNPQDARTEHCLQAMSVAEPVIPTLVIATVHDVLWMKLMLRDFAMGYITTEQSIDDFELALSHLSLGDTYVPQRYIKSLMSEAPRKIPQMSNREKLIARFLVSGQSHQEIADQLHISVRPVSSHKTNLIARLGLKGIPDLVRFHDKHPFVFKAHSAKKKKRDQFH